MRSVLNVFLTVDTEVWPYAAGWPVTALPPGKTDFSGELEAYITGRTPHGDFGVPYQLDVLDRHGLKGVYFVEGLFASVAGLDALKDIVGLVQGRGHEVQLHVHTEWLREIARPGVPAPFRQHIREFPEDDQARIVAHALANLRAAGAREVCAFRAGNYGANNDTLRALARNGVRFDTSHDACYLDSACAIETGGELLQPELIDGVYEFPVSVFSDYPGHLRHAQLCACSSAEMELALMEAWRAGWHSFVIVWHGFELLRHVRNPAKRAPDRINIRRFERLAAFLAAHRDKFSTSRFSEIDPRLLSLPINVPPIRSRLRHTAWRFAEQAVSRWL